MKACLLFVIISVLSCAHLNGETIVLLKGTACAGKTSVINLCAQHPTIKTISDDAIWYDCFPKLWEQLFPFEYEDIKKAIEPCNIVHAVLWGNLLFKKNSTGIDNINAIIAIGTIRRILDYPEVKELYSFSKMVLPSYHQAILDALHEKKTVIIDAWWLSKEKYNQHIQNGHILKVVLAYCNLQEMINRLEQRRAQALAKEDLSSFRYVRQLLCSFYHDFKPVNSHDENCIDVLSRSQVEEVFKRAENMLEQDTYTFNNYGAFSLCELTQESLVALKELFIRKFHLNLQETIGISSESPVDYVIRFDRGTPEENANQLLNILKLN
jgi:hypothetical protein